MEDFGEFKRLLPSSEIKPRCEYSKSRGDDTGIFTITYFDRIKNKEHTFFIYRGIDPSTCLDLEKKVIRLKKQYKFLTLSGANSVSKLTDREVSWFWNFLTGGKECVSYFINLCEEQKKKN